jgi:hypothetical protein
MDVVVIMNFFGRETSQVKADLYQEIANPVPRARNPGLQGRLCHGQTSASYSAQLQTVPEAIVVRARKRRPRDAPRSLTKSPNRNSEAVGAAALLMPTKYYLSALRFWERNSGCRHCSRDFETARNQNFTVQIENWSLNSEYGSEQVVKI